MRVLVACEFSGVVRDAFAAHGHDAWSCDLLDTEADAKKHLVGNVMHAIRSNYGPWDLMVAFPPCTHLCSSGARWFPRKLKEQDDAIRFVQSLMNAPVERIAIENPIGVLSTVIRKPDQIIQPWMFGHGETKATCLWLKHLPKLVPTDVVDGRVPRVHHASPGPNRWRERSRTLAGIANAMASQWGTP